MLLVIIRRARCICAEWIALGYKLLTFDIVKEKIIIEECQNLDIGLDIVNSIAVANDQKHIAFVDDELAN